MLNVEIAALAYFFAPLGQKIYFGDVQEGAIIPAIFIPIPDITSTEASLSFYKDQFAIFIKFIDKDSVSAFNTARKAARMLQDAKKTIPLYDELGYKTDKSFYIDKVDTKVVDTGVAQIYMTWNCYDDYKIEESQMMANIDFDINMTEH